jgi:hypothetical protein
MCDNLFTVKACAVGSCFQKRRGTDSLNYIAGVFLMQFEP